MLKKIALATLFAITFAVGAGTASARSARMSPPTAPVPHALCPWGSCAG